MQIVRPDTRIDFVSQTRLFGMLSGTVVVGALLLMLLTSINWGIEFVGGTVVEVAVPEAVGAADEGTLRSAMSALGFPDAVVVRIGSADAREFRVQLRATQEENQALSLQVVGGLNRELGAGIELRELDTAVGGVALEVALPERLAEVGETQLREALRRLGLPGEVTRNGPGPRGFRIEVTGPRAEEDDLPLQLLTGLNSELGVGVEPRKIDSIGPRVGGEMRRAGFLAVAIACGLILLYVWVRFDLRYAPGAVAALVHDVMITAGVFVALGLEFNLQVVAALLVVIGYSLNDTIVIYDRIRENMELRGTTHLEDVVNQSVNQTLSRTLLTSMTTLAVVLSLLVLGGPVIRDFALALMIGVTVGTYSTIYVASSLLILLERYYGRRTAAA